MLSTQANTHACMHACKHAHTSPPTHSPASTHAHDMHAARTQDATHGMGGWDGSAGGGISHAMFAPAGAVAAILLPTHEPRWTESPGVTEVNDMVTCAHVRRHASRHLCRLVRRHVYVYVYGSVYRCVCRHVHRHVYRHLAMQRPSKSASMWRWHRHFSLVL